MPLFLPDPTYAAIQANPRRQRNRGWAFAAVPPAGPTVIYGGTAASTGTQGMVVGGTAASTGTQGVMSGGNA
jgi:hypothetical protein